MARRKNGPTDGELELRGLPTCAFSVLPDEKGRRLDQQRVICIRRGERGYHMTDWRGGRPVAERLNRRGGVTRAQEEAMVIGSMCGWEVPGADPKAHESSFGTEVRA